MTFNAAVLQSLRSSIVSYLLLLHQLGIRTIINNILPKNRRSQGGINLLGVHILQLPVQNKIIPLGPQTHRRLLAQQYESKNIPILLPAIEEEGVWVDAVGDCAADKGDDVED